MWRRGLNTRQGCTLCDHEMTLGVRLIAAAFCKRLSCAKWLPRQSLPWLLVKHFEHEAEGNQLILFSAPV